MKLNCEWVHGKNPEVEKLYLVRVDYPALHFSTPSLRRWKDGGWQLTGPSETIATWLDGLEL